VLTAVPTAIAGVSDWLDTAQGERRVGLIHAAANATALTGYTASWLLRRAGRHRAGITVSSVSGGFLILAGWLGAHLVYAAGVGVDTTAFQKFPTKWTDAGLEFDDLPSETAVEVSVEGVPLLVSRSGRSVHAIANRCTHRGAPLDEGEIADGCVTCPWHGSQFDLTDGAVRRGPATRPQPALEARVTQGRVEVRRPDEARALRLNPVGV
jgi:nitrite reductase/ring-hydroxylating ferredoxin subunit